jgi:hypothetical protein
LQRLHQRGHTSSHLRLHCCSRVLLLSMLLLSKETWLRWQLKHGCKASA